MGRLCNPESLQGLLEPYARTTRTYGSEGAGTQQCVPATRHESRPKLVVSADGHGVVSHAGSRLLADLADATGLTTAFTAALRQLRPRGTGHPPAGSPWTWQ
ncbi:hypothetical protein GCM10022206_37710 [Streptomyces chiangmaiensis]